MADSLLFTLPLEVRLLIYSHLITIRRDPPQWQLDHSQPRLATSNSPYSSLSAFSSHSSSSPRLVENWWALDSLHSTSTALPFSLHWLSSMISLTHISPLLRTCSSIHTELSEYIYSRLIWHARVGRYSVPATPLQLCPRYHQYVRHFSLDLQHECDADGILQGTDHVYIKYSDFWRNLWTFAKLVEATGRERGVKSLSVVALLPSDQAVVDVMDALEPLKECVEEVRVGWLGYSKYDRASFGTVHHLSNSGYQRLRQIFGVETKWSFPDIEAQYKD